MRPENKAMMQYLEKEGLPRISVKHIATGSLSGCWRLTRRSAEHGKLFEDWNQVDAARLNALGFRGFDGQLLGTYSGNGGMWQIFVRGHNELLQRGN